MPKIAFLGISERPIRVKASQAAATAEATIGDETGGIDKGDGDGTLAPASGDVDIYVNRRVGTAPAGFFFSAKAFGFDDGGDPDFDHYYDVRYKWTFSDPGWYTRHDTEDLPWGKYYEVDGEVVLVEDGRTPQGTNVRFLGNDRNVAYGPHCVHVFDRPGEYEIVCEVQRRGEAALKKPISILVEAPETYFADAATICVSPSGNFEGAPPRAQQVKTYAEAVALASSADPDLRILLRRGETHDNPWSLASPQRSHGFSRLQHGAFPVDGTELASIGPKPLSTDAEKPGGEGAIWGIRKQGTYDPTDPWNSPNTGEGNGAVTGTATFHTIWDCEFAGMDTGISVSQDTKNVVIGNVHIHDWYNYGTFFGRGVGLSGFCGAWIKQNPHTVIGAGKNEKAPPYYADHGPFRCSATDGALAFNLCDLRSANSWAGFYQPNIRPLRSPYDYDNILVEEGVVERVRGENGSTLLTAGGDGLAVARKYLFDKVYSVEANQSGEFASVFGTPGSGMRFRNCVAVLPDTPRVGGGTLRFWLRRGGSFSGDHESIGQHGVDVYNCTLVDLRQASFAGGGMILFEEDNVAAFKYVRFCNNVFWVPDAARFDTTADDEPLEMGTLWAVTNPGVKWENDLFDTAYGYEKGTAAFYKPKGSSKAIGSASEGQDGKSQFDRIALDDFFGRLRPLASASRGAIEPI